MSETSGRAARVTVTAFGLTDPGRVRKNNEDAFLVTRLAEAAGGAAPDKVSTLEADEHAVLLAVSDGMGGANAGEVASALVVESLRRAMLDAKGDWDEATKKAVESANREVWSAAKAPGRKGMGATLTAVCVHGDQAHIAEVGDSRAYLVRNGKIRQVTRDQSFVQLLVESGALKPEEAEHYPMKNIVLQAMGQSPDVKVALGRLELRRGDRLLLCSDGLSNMVSSADMLAALEKAESLDAACKELVARANERGGEDNITVVIAEVDGEALAVPRAQETLTQTFEVLAEYKAAAAQAGIDFDEQEGEQGEDAERDEVKAAEERAPSPPPASTSPRAPSREVAPAKGSGPNVIAIAAVLVALAIVAFLLLRR